MKLKETFFREMFEQAPCVFHGDKDYFEYFLSFRKFPWEVTRSKLRYLHHHTYAGLDVMNSVILYKSVNDRLSSLKCDEGQLLTKEIDAFLNTNNWKKLFLKHLIP